MMGPISYGLCFLTSTVCVLLLWKKYYRTRVKLLLWSGLAFVFFSVQNLILFVDMVLVPQTDLTLFRALTGLAGALVLLLAQIWESN